MSERALPKGRGQTARTTDETRRLREIRERLRTLERELTSLKPRRRLPAESA